MNETCLNPAKKLLSETSLLTSKIRLSTSTETGTSLVVSNVCVFDWPT